MAVSVKQLLDAAHNVVPRISPAEVKEMMTDDDTLIIDVRDAPEIEGTGKVAGAINISRGMLEFRADPVSPFYDKRLVKTKTLILYCSSGGRAALSGKVLKEMGYESVFNLGAFKAWSDSDGPIDLPTE